MAEPYFKKAFKGYDTKQVDEFIVELSDTYSEKEKEFAEQAHIAQNEIERLNGEVARLRKEAEEAAQEHAAELSEKQKEYDALCAEVGEKMVTADKRAADIVRNAEREAAIIKEQAQTEAENEARMIKQNAVQEAEKLVADTEKRCEELTRAAEEFRRRQNEMQQSIYETERQFGDALNKLRDGIGSNRE
ncbi:MAG: DivIVA domain-containing protein [Clostridia bacterium]|nr:DivIVA domain-containing protein [Clostridia bacterium]MBR4799981.1 DivIVA domain-containing protein [Clostridia bacterium]MBR5745706.1 DivIVA domain-containing protein [Clostridia bacterium]